MKLKGKISSCQGLHRNYTALVSTLAQDLLSTRFACGSSDSSSSIILKAPNMPADSTLSTHVTLISSDGFEFIVLREAAYVAGTIKKMLDPTSSWS